MKVVVAASYDRSLVTFRGPLIRAMIQGGHQVVAAAPVFSASSRRFLQDLGVTCVEVRMARTGVNPVPDLFTMAAYYRLLRKERPQLLLAYTVKPIVYGGMAARLAGIRGFFPMVTGLGYAFTGDAAGRRLVSTVVRHLYRAALKGSRAVFFQNPDDLEEFRRRGILGASARAVVINGSGVDLDDFAAVPLPREPVFFMAARLLKDKGVREYAEAARIVRRAHPEARFRLAGWLDRNPSAIKRDELAAWVEEGVLEYLGALEDVRPALAKARVYVLPSYREGTPRSVLEAMSMGRPVVTTDVPGCRETVIDGVSGFRVPARDPGALAAACLRFVEQPELADCMGREGRRLAEERYDVHKVNAVILETMGLAG
ncbi:glycosyltransferase family 4 protein [Dissulfurirhabdus thermomarina]|uniref:Glycosyltransferase family 4 protein n=1 Tax=Dissulfurirhabdus thermomarina TaxID=1765737 RepID=A0A6N9TLF8_DISTH|nr:glycosyltransferase family 4 protein [Dissulfurirhabdus thermomarina]NMX22579.1 glycosyltransferase family 4 protein [Dissulfurirhabdus thermomarina]